jgi:hypothetical protein
MGTKNLGLIFNHRGVEYSLVDFPKEKIKWTLIETLVLEARCSSVAASFSEMAADDRQLAWDNILLNGAACTGCELPGSDIFASRIASQISNYIFSFGFKDYNLDEIFLAHQLNAHGNFDELKMLDIDVIPFQGKYFNLNYFAAVLGNYKKIRDFIDRRLQNFLDGYDKKF